MTSEKKVSENINSSREHLVMTEQELAEIEEANKRRRNRRKNKFKDMLGK